MAPPPQFDPSMTIITALVSGTVIAAGITVLANWLAQRRQHRQEIQRQMLSVIRSYCEKYYFRLASSAFSTSWASRKIKEGEEWLLLAFYHLCGFFDTLHKFYLDGHFYFLGYIKGEIAVAKLQDKIWNTLKAGGYTLSELSDLAEIGGQKETFKSFQDRASSVIFGDNILKKVKKFREFLDNNEHFVQYLDCYSRLLMYEINVVFQIWYEDLLPHLEEELGDCLSIIRQEVEGYRTSPEYIYPPR